MELKQALIKIDVATNGELYDFCYGGWKVNVTETNKTLAEFEEASKNYSECDEIQRGKLAGFDFIYFGIVQVVKGYPRFALSVIDLGAVRFTINKNLTYYAD
jgi:hypothetical protein